MRDYDLSSKMSHRELRDFENGKRDGCGNGLWIVFVDSLRKP
jgi:hypothetical protein